MYIIGYLLYNVLTFSVVYTSPINLNQFELKLSKLASDKCPSYKPLVINSQFLDECKLVDIRQITKLSLSNENDMLCVMYYQVFENFCTEADETLLTGIITNLTNEFKEAQNKYLKNYTEVCSNLNVINVTLIPQLLQHVFADLEKCKRLCTDMDNNVVSLCSVPTFLWSLTQLGKEKTKQNLKIIPVVPINDQNQDTMSNNNNNAAVKETQLGKENTKQNLKIMPVVPIIDQNQDTMSNNNNNSAVKETPINNSSNLNITNLPANSKVLLNTTPLKESVIRTLEVPKNKEGIVTSQDSDQNKTKILINQNREAIGEDNAPKSSQNEAQIDDMTNKVVQDDKDEDTHIKSEMANKNNTPDVVKEDGYQAEDKNTKTNDVVPKNKQSQVEMGTKLEKKEENAQQKNIEPANEKKEELPVKPVDHKPDPAKNEIQSDEKADPDKTQEKQNEEDVDMDNAADSEAEFGNENDLPQLEATKVNEPLFGSKDEPDDEAPPPKSSEVKSKETIVKPKKIEEDSLDIAVNHNNQNIDDSNSYFFSYFMMVCVMFICGYVAYHNKQKILALVLEGRKGRRSSRSRRPNSANYRKLDSTLEEAVTSSCKKNTTQVIY